MVIYLKFMIAVICIAFAKETSHEKFMALEVKHENIDSNEHE